MAWLNREAAWLGNSAAAAGVVLYADPPYLNCKTRHRYRYPFYRSAHEALLKVLTYLKHHGKNP